MEEDEEGGVAAVVVVFVCDLALLILFFFFIFGLVVDAFAVLLLLFFFVWFVLFGLVVERLVVVVDICSLPQLQHQHQNRHNHDRTLEQAVQGAPDKVHAWVGVTPGAHTLNHVNPITTFMAIASGTALHNAYAYLAGMRLTPINEVRCCFVFAFVFF